MREEILTLQNLKEKEQKNLEYFSSEIEKKKEEILTLIEKEKNVKR